MIYCQACLPESAPALWGEVPAFFPLAGGLEMAVLADDAAAASGSAPARLFAPAPFITGLHRQASAPMDVRPPAFNGLCNGVCNGLCTTSGQAAQLGACDLARAQPQAALRQVQQFLARLGPHRLRHGKPAQFNPPGLWPMCQTGAIRAVLAHQLFQGSGLVAIPQIGMAGLGRFAIKVLHRLGAERAQRLPSLAAPAGQPLKWARLGDVPAH